LDAVPRTSEGGGQGGVGVELLTGGLAELTGERGGEGEVL